MEDIHDIKGFVPLPHNLWWLWLLLAGVVIGVIALWLWRRKRAPTAAGAVTPLSAYEVAVHALQRLREQNPPVEEFYTRLSGIVRQYLEGQFGSSNNTAWAINPNPIIMSTTAWTVARITYRTTNVRVS